MNTIDTRRSRPAIAAIGAILAMAVFAALPAWSVDSSVNPPPCPFSRGVNLTSWFEAPSPRQIQFSRFSKRDFEDLKRLGFDFVRLPINLHAMAGPAPEYRLDPLFLGFLDQAIDWAEAVGLYIIVDNHTFDPVVPTDPKVGDILVKVWPQLASRYRSRSPLVVYEVLNEPHGIALDRWARIQAKAIEAIRAEDQTHPIVVGSANYNNFRDIVSLPAYKDRNLIYTFHFYDPYLFTHQGANWGDPVLTDLAGMPYPYDAKRMPKFPRSLSGMWLRGAYDNYRREGTDEHVRSLIDIAWEFARKRGVPIFCGEFGAFQPNSAEEDRARWCRATRSHLEARGIAWALWDYAGGFGIYSGPRGGSVDSDLSVPVAEALGLSIPPQRPRVRGPVVPPLEVYADYPAPGIFTGGYGEPGSVDYYDERAPASGRFSIRWGNCKRYRSFAFDFRDEQDLSSVVASGGALEFRARCSAADAYIDVRFINPGFAPGEIPWRMSMPIGPELLPRDGEWHTVRIPLGDMKDSGGWRDGWFPSKGLFDWKRVARLEFAAEHADLDGIEFGFDEIRVVR